MKIEKDYLTYKIEDDLISFWCNPADGNSMAATLFDDFLLDLSEGKKVFLYGYRLPDEEVHKIISCDAILTKAKVLLDPFKSFFHLSAAKVNSDCFDHASTTTIYYFNEDVEWTDFLATWAILKPKKFMKKGMLPAYFVSGDQGADFWFSCNRTYESKVFQLFEDLSKAGYEIKQSSRFYDVLK